MAVPDWIWFVFIFAFGCCIGSFLNVVIYRLPRDLSLVRPGSACPACGRHIRFYDNIPLVSWLVLWARCRYCRSPISPRYFAVELLTGVVFLGLFVLYFRSDVRLGIAVNEGGWFIYVSHAAMLSAFIAASAIDLERWIIPLSICWFATAVGMICSAVGPLVIHPRLVDAYMLLPRASAGTGALAVGGAIGLGVSWLLLTTGLLKRSYATSAGSEPGSHKVEANQANPFDSSGQTPEHNFNHRREICKEIIFLLPVVVCAAGAYWIMAKTIHAEARAQFHWEHPVVAGFLGSLWGYFVGCGIVWVIRILGTLAFGKEAMGLGDVHLMGAAGAVVGPAFVVIAFFIAPFYGLAWAGSQMLFRKIRQIPYGPFLSLGVLTVMILHNYILNRIGFLFLR